jgi:hypothetical protein
MAEYPYKYAQKTAPFDFLGTFCVTQKAALKSWIAARKGNLGDIQKFHQIRAQQLRKSAGLLEEYYAVYNDQMMTPTFKKDSWQPGPSGHFPSNVDNDHLPMVVMSKIKDRFKEQLQRDEEGMFSMNRIRCLIEKHEDAAQYANEATDSANTENIAALLASIDSYFNKPEYTSVLVDDTLMYPAGGTQPYFRVNPFDTPTQFELEQMNHSAPGVPIKLKQG